MMLDNITDHYFTVKRNFILNTKIDRYFKNVGKGLSLSNVHCYQGHRQESVGRAFDILNNNCCIINKKKKKITYLIEK